MTRPTVNELSLMKRASHEALQRALEAQPGLESLLKRLWVETQQATERRPHATQAVLYRRTATLFELFVDRAGWRR
jgi:hypothetical protein